MKLITYQRQYNSLWFFSDTRRKWEKEKNSGDVDGMRAGGWIKTGGIMNGGDYVMCRRKGGGFPPNTQLWPAG